MKAPNTLSYFFVFCFVLSTNLFAKDGWKKDFKSQKVFVENKGQFKSLTGCDFDNVVDFAYQSQHERFFFSSTGVQIEYITGYKLQRTDEEKRMRAERKLLPFSEAEWTAFEREGHRMDYKIDILKTHWIGGDPNAQVEVRSEKPFTYNATYYDRKGNLNSVSNAKAFDKIIYKNIYPNIDVVYEIHPESGFKYSLIVRPGGDISNIQLAYNKNISLQENGEINTATKLGKVIDHKPYTFYLNTNKVIVSSYRKIGSAITFDIDNYDPTQTIVIDPWTQSPNFNTNWDCVWECERDSSGNVYVIGGVMPLELRKYDANGVFLWSYSTPYDTSNTWLGTLATDNQGNSYVTEGTGGGMHKINTLGNLVWNRTGNAGGLLTEFWTIAFNNDQSQLTIGGTGSPSSSQIYPHPYIYTMNASNGIITSAKNLFTGPANFNDLHEVRSITAANEMYFYITHDSIGKIGACFLPTDTALKGYSKKSNLKLGYKCENWRVNNSGIQATKVFGNHLYVHRGDSLLKYTLNHINLVSKIKIPNGSFVSGFTNFVVCSGIDIDNCGNIYVGTTRGIAKFDIGLNYIDSFSTSFFVYDVSLGSNGSIVATGSTGNSSSGARVGSIQVFNASACSLYVPSEIHLCSPPSVCVTDSAFQIIASEIGGIFSGNGVSSSGIFNPLVAGVGTHIISYSLGNRTSLIDIYVKNCRAISVCKNSNNFLVVQNGIAPYNWYFYKKDSILIPITQQQCQSCGGSWLLGSCSVAGCTNPPIWVQIGYNTLSIPVPSHDSLMVIDSIGNTLISYNTSNLPSCISCPFNVTVDSIKNASCGQSDGAVYLSITSTLFPLDLIFGNQRRTITSAGVQIFSSLQNGSYSFQIQDNSGCTISQTVGLSSSIPCRCNNLVINHSFSNYTCDGKGSIIIQPLNGSGSYSYQWQNSADTLAQRNNISSGSYCISVVDNGLNCFLDSCFVFNGWQAPVISYDTIIPASCFGAANGLVIVAASSSNPYSLYLLPFTNLLDTLFQNTNPNFNNLLQGVYVLGVRDDSTGCHDTIIQSITSNSIVDSISMILNPDSTSGKIWVNTSGNNSILTFTWSPNISINDTAFFVARDSAFYIRVEDTSGCVFDTIIYIPSIINGLKNFENSIFDYVNIFPNPATDFVSVSVRFFKKTDVSVSFFDAIGKVIFKNEFQNQNTLDLNLPIELLAPGIYIVEIKVPLGRVYKKVVVE